MNEERRKLYNRWAYAGAAIVLVMSVSTLYTGFVILNAIWEAL